MISNPRNQPTLAREVSTLVKLLSWSLRRLTVQLLGLTVTLLLVNCLGGQALSQSLASSDPGEWTSLVAPAVESNRQSFDNPLTDLRQPDPSNLLAEELATEQIVGNTSYSHGQHRDEPTLVIGWSQPGLRHRELYFEDAQIERGNVNRRFPNVAAGAEFVKSLLVFPIRLVTGK